MAQFQIDPRRTAMLPDDMQRVNEEIIMHFRPNAASIAEGRFKGAAILLLSTTGARSGKDRLTPVVHTRDGDR